MSERPILPSIMSNRTWRRISQIYDTLPLMSAQTKGKRARHVKEIRRSARKFSTVLRLMSAQKLVIMAIRKWYDTRLYSHYHYKWHFNCSLIWNQLLSTSWKSHTSCSVLFDPNNVFPVFQKKVILKMKFWVSRFEIPSVTSVWTNFKLSWSSDPKVLFPSC